MQAAPIHRTAVVLIPPEDAWEPIQAIRRAYDRKLHRWMPHITLLYPFRPRDAFDEVTPALQQACLEIPTMQLTLEDFHFFDHGCARYTVWLEPEPQDALVRLHEAIWRVTSDCDHIRRFPGGFIPHLSIGQITGRKRLDELLERLQANWRPLTFTAHEISLIWRETPPDDVFRVDRSIRLGDHHSKQTSAR